MFSQKIRLCKHKQNHVQEKIPKEILKLKKSNTILTLKI